MSSPAVTGSDTAELPLFRHHRLDSIISGSGTTAITTARLLADASALAERLPAAEQQLNLCERRYPFLVGLLAALLRGQLVVLPASRAAAELQRVAAQPGTRYALTDSSITVAGIERVDYRPAPAGHLWQGPLPTLPGAQAVVELYTSGSSGQPTRHRKCWGELVTGAELTGLRLGLGALTGGYVVATVPPQHMFGLEASILLPLQWGLALTDGQPLFPADIAASLEQCAAPRVLVTTPLHLHGLATAGVTLPRLAATLSATAPLAAPLAERFEALSAAPLFEIYGSTESGAIATRRTVEGEAWHPLDTVQLQEQEGRWAASGGHITTPQWLHDRLEPLADGRFRLLGRDTDLLKVAGKRASLADLNQRLLSIAGVVDGTFFLPTSTAPTPRLCAFVVTDGTPTATIVSALRQLLDPVFLPRPLYTVASLPRNATGKLPRQPLERLYRACQPGGQ